MNTKILSTLAAGIALAGCCTCDFGVDPKDPVVGNWGLKLGYESMSAGHMIVSRDADGKAQALVLWRWASDEERRSRRQQDYVRPSVGL